ncbi:MAG: hypothetical protein QG616_760 [Pseudomonadota bacterium]|nr:hypothetical protein [Pseudomonadota bacterium]
MNFIRNLFRLPPKPQKAGDINNVLHIERVRRAHFVNATARAIRAQGLDSAHAVRAEHYADTVWQKHRDNIPGYQIQRECEQMVRDYVDLLAIYQRNDQKPVRPWSPSAA